jgi:hypothetical protein
MARHVELAVHYAFGLNGTVGAELEYQTGHGIMAAGVIGGRVNEHLFIGIEVRSGLTRRAPSVAFGFQLHFYFGPYRTAGLD